MKKEGSTFEKTLTVMHDTVRCKEERTRNGNYLLHVREYHNHVGFEVLIIHRIVCDNCCKVIRQNPPIKRFILSGNTFECEAQCECGAVSIRKY
jgi:hypothetical protein